MHYLATTLGQARQQAKGQPLDLHAVLQRSIDEIEQRYAADTHEQASLLRFAGELNSELFDDEAAAPLLRRFLASPVAQAEPAEAANVRLYLAQAEQNLGNGKAADEALQAAQAFWKQDPVMYRDILLRSRIVEGQILRSLGKPDDAIALYRKSVPEATDVLGPHAEVTVQLSNSLGLALMQTGQLDEAAAVMDRVLAAYDHSALSADADSRLLAYQNRGAIAYRQGRYAEAEPLLAKAANERRDLFGPSAALASADLNLAKARVALGKADDALPLLDAALPMARQYTGAHSVLTIAVLQASAEAQLARKDVEAAAARIDEVETLTRTQLSATHPLYAMSLILHARLDALRADSADANSELDRAQAILEAAGSAGKALLPQIAKARAELKPAG